MGVRALAAALVALVCLVSVRASAQGDAGDVQAAARAFDQAQAAQLQEDYGRAAELFELADRLAPSAVALRSAIRAHLAAENDVRAATLALVALDRYASDASTRQVADEALRVAPQLTRLEIRCAEPCAITVDGGAAVTSAVEALDLFVQPGDHRVRATWPGREASITELSGDAGGVVRVDLEPPAAPEPEPAPEPPAPEPEPPPATAPTEVRATTPAPPVDRGDGLPTWVFWSGVGLTAVATGIAVWSGLDTLAARDDYVEMPTEDAYEQGVDLERRTNVAIGASIGLALVTATVGLLWTDWGREEPSELTTGAWLDGEGGGLAVEGRF